MPPIMMNALHAATSNLPKITVTLRKILDALELANKLKAVEIKVKWCDMLSEEEEKILTEATKGE